MIFLFGFEKALNGTNFLLNDGIAADMLPEFEEVFNTTIDLTARLLEVYKPLSKDEMIFSATVLDNNNLDLKFSEGLGKYIEEKTKDMIYKNATVLANMCAAIMDASCKKKEIK